MKNYEKPDQWDIYRSCFDEGQEVCLIDTEDNVWFGNLQTTEAHAVLVRSGGRSQVVPWEECRFMCHDGFPYKQLEEKFDPKTLIERLAMHNVADVVREHLDDAWGEVANMDDVPKQVRYAIFGDPFEITRPVTAEIFSPGSKAEWPNEELVVLTADDGAKAQLFDLHTVLHWEPENSAARLF